jgi:tRNA threonylcarbamoyladenosine biosynthesis protein TsaE
VADAFVCPFVCKARAGQEAFNSCVRSYVSEIWRIKIDISYYVHVGHDSSCPFFWCAKTICSTSSSIISFPAMKQLLLTESSSAEETEEIARELASILKAGDVVALYGPLGAGKTTFVRGLAAGLGCQKGVRSPTFSLINEYPGPLPLYHIDFYRLEGQAEIEDLGWTEYLDSDGVVAIEWPEKVKNMLPVKRFEVYLKFYGENARTVEIIALDNTGN